MGRGARVQSRWRRHGNSQRALLTAHSQPPQRPSLGGGGGGAVLSSSSRSLCRSSSGFHFSNSWFMETGLLCSGCIRLEGASFRYHSATCFDVWSMAVYRFSVWCKSTGRRRDLMVLHLLKQRHACFVDDAHVNFGKQHQRVADPCVNTGDQPIGFLRCLTLYRGPGRTVMRPKHYATATRCPQTQGRGSGSGWRVGMDRYQ